MYGACGARQNESSGSPLQPVAHREPLAAGSPPRRSRRATPNSITIMPSAARMPLRSAARAAASGKKYMSLKQVTPAAQHLGAREQRAVLDEFGRYQAHFHRPDVVLQPVHERAVVGQPAHERHRRVRMQIDEAGNQDMPGQLGAPGAQDSARGLRRAGSTSTIRPRSDHHRMVVEHDAGPAPPARPRPVRLR